MTRTKDHERSDDRGSLSLFFVVVAFALFVLIGLVVDGGGTVAALERAQDLAAQAGRQAAEAVNGPTVIRGHGGGIDTARARAAAAQYLAAAGADGQVTVLSATRLEVTTTVRYQPTFLTVLGVGTQIEHGHATVNLQTGT